MTATWPGWSPAQLLQIAIGSATDGPWDRVRGRSMKSMQESVQQTLDRIGAAARENLMPVRRRKRNMNVAYWMGLAAVLAPMAAMLVRRAGRRAQARTIEDV